eukprot:365917-Chlamydomonas_euryale.AAC.1
MPASVHPLSEHPRQRMQRTAARALASRVARTQQQQQVLVVGLHTARVGAHPASAAQGALAARQWGETQPVWAHTQRVRSREHLLPGSGVRHSPCGRSPSECGAGSTC